MKEQLYKFVSRTIKKHGFKAHEDALFLATVMYIVRHGTIDPYDWVRPYGCSVKSNSNGSTILEIQPWATKQDVLNFVETIWSDMVSPLEKQGSEYKLPRIRETKNKKRDEYIYKLAQKSNEELGVTLENRRTKDVAIASLVKKKFGTPIQPEAVRQVISRQRRYRDT